MRTPVPLGLGAVILGGAIAVTAQGRGSDPIPRDHAAIGYTTRPLHDRLSQLSQKLNAETVHLAFDPANGYLRSMLAALDVPVESQSLVFSKTSVHADRISERNPRALFFDDSVAVGWVRGADVLELAAQDPEQGAVFYTLEQQPTEMPRLTRQTDECLPCHLSRDYTLAIPGFLVLSAFPMSDDPRAYADGIGVDHRTPFEERWGGWFVTGRSVARHHLGNLPVVRPAAQLANPPPTPALESIEGRFDTTGYPTLYSDVAALLVLNHQAHMTDELTRLGWEARLLEYQRTQATHGEPASAKAQADRMEDAARSLVDYLLFVDEAPFGSAIAGSSGFAEQFSARGPRDHKGRSLRQLDLERRLMRYPCSYMIYSETFDALLSIAKDAVYRRMWRILSGQEQAGPYARLSLTDRQAIVDILRDTKKDLPEYFQAVTQ